MLSDEQLGEILRTELRAIADTVPVRDDFIEALMPKPRSGRRRWLIPGSRRVLRWLPAAVTCAVVLVIVVGAVVLIHGSNPDRVVAPPPTAATDPGAAELIDRLAVLRRPQTAADQLPATVIRNWTHGVAYGGAGRLLPRLSRLVGTEGPVRLYLVVTTAGVDGLWSARDGDQVTVVEVTPAGAAEAAESIPAAALDDSDIISGASVATSTAVSRRYGYWVSVIPDSVATVRWTVTSTSGAPRRQQIPITNNVALLPLISTREATDGVWYSADGTRTGTNTTLLQRLVNQRQRQARDRALSVAERQHITPSPEILAAYTIFSFTRRTRLSDGVVVSHPTLQQLPTAVLNLSENERHGEVDLSDARKFEGPGGATMYVLPGRATICAYYAQTYGPGVSGGSGGCAPSLHAALTEGVGDASSGGFGHHGQINIGVVPRAHPTITMTIAGGRTRTITPLDGIYVVSS